MFGLKANMLDIIIILWCTLASVLIRVPAGPWLKTRTPVRADGEVRKSSLPGRPARHMRSLGFRS